MEATTNKQLHQTSSGPDNSTAFKNKNVDGALWNACKFGDAEQCKAALEKGANPDGCKDTLKSIEGGQRINQSSSPLCAAAHKGFEEIVGILIEHGADVNVRVDSLVVNRSALSSFTTTTSSDSSENDTRRHLPPGHSSVVPYYDTPLTLAIKYGHTAIAKKLVENGAEVLLNYGNTFEKSPLQETIRLYRTDCLNMIYEHASRSKINVFNQTTSEFEMRSIDDVLRMHKNDIVKQCLINDNAEALAIFIPILWNSDHLNSDLMMTSISNLMLKNKVQTDKAAHVLQTILEHIPEDTLKLYDFALFLKGFLRLLSARFLSISDERFTLLLYRANLFFIVMKYHKELNFENYLQELDSCFMNLYDTVRDTGENKMNIIEFMMNFYENLILMGHLRLTPAVIVQILNYKHVIEFEKIQEYLLFRATRPLTLKDICRLRIKQNMKSYKRASIDCLRLQSPDLYDYVYYLV